MRNAKNKLNSGKLQNALMKDLKVLKVPQMNSNQVESMIKKNGQNFSMLFPEKFDKYKVDDVVRRQKYEHEQIRAGNRRLTIDELLTPKTVMKAIERKSLDSKDRLALLEKGMNRIGVPVPIYAKTDAEEGEEKKREDPLVVLARFEKEREREERAAHRRVFSE